MLFVVVVGCGCGWLWLSMSISISLSRRRRQCNTGTLVYIKVIIYRYQHTNQCTYTYILRTQKKSFPKKQNTKKLKTAAFFFFSFLFVLFRPRWTNNKNRIFATMRGVWRILLYVAGWLCPSGWLVMLWYNMPWIVLYRYQVYYILHHLWSSFCLGYSTTAVCGVRAVDIMRRVHILCMNDM